jgi:N-acetylglucosaminyldiphosphoundecaprenol N-acetyl-beta-D-mannosaminyltransferase
LAGVNRKQADRVTDSTAPAPADDPAAFPRVTVLGLRICAVDMTGVCAAILGCIRAGRRTEVVLAAVHSIFDAMDEPRARHAMVQATLCLPDGVPLVWLCRAGGHAGAQRIFGPDLMLALSEHIAAERGLSVFYFGGAPGVAEDLAARMEAAYPGLRTAGTLCPPFRPPTESEDEAHIAAINDSGADVLWVGLGSPKQEAWIDAHRDRLTVPVRIGIGAAFDYNTGRIRRAPRWMQACALEWLFRLVQEPRRLWRRYARNNPLFLWWLFCERVGLKRF